MLDHVDIQTKCNGSPGVKCFCRYGGIIVDVMIDGYVTVYLNCSNNYIGPIHCLYMYTLLYFKI